MSQTLMTLVNNILTSSANPADHPFVDAIRQRSTIARILQEPCYYIDIECTGPDTITLSTAYPLIFPTDLVEAEALEHTLQAAINQAEAEAPYPIVFRRTQTLLTIEITLVMYDGVLAPFLLRHAVRELDQISLDVFGTLQHALRFARHVPQLKRNKPE